jgi:LysM repeat protein
LNNILLINIFRNWSDFKMPQNFEPRCPRGMDIYIVQYGDTLYQIAVNSGTTVRAILNANPHINPYQLFVGQRICVPTRPSTFICPSGNFYNVRAGDTLGSIAVHFGVDFRDLLAANPSINPDFLYIGQRICIPRPRYVPPRERRRPERRQPERQRPERQGQERRTQQQR